jgi:dimethylargininase
MIQTEINYGPRLIGSATGSLRAALLVRPNESIEKLPPLIGEPAPIFQRTREQHGILVKTLEYYGVEVTVIEDITDEPLAPAANDLAVCFENGAILMRPSWLSRRSEVERLEAEFARIDIPICGSIAAPGILDGSDVLLVGSTAFIGVSRRSNALGRAAFAEAAREHGYDSVEVKLDPRAPSLRAIANAASKDTIVIATERVDETVFGGFKLVRLERGEELGAGVFALGDGRIIANMRYRTSLNQIRRAGIAVESIDLYDFGKVGIVPADLILALKRS